MRRIKIILFIILISGILLFAGCDFFSFGVFKEEDKDSSSVITLAPDKDAQITSAVTEDTPEQEKTQSKEDNSGTEQAPTSAIAPAEIIDLPLYSVNVSSGETEPIIATVPKDTEITPELIVDQVVESMADRSLDVGVKSVTSEKDAVIVDFYKDKAPLSEMGSAYEVAILDAIAMSLIDNLTDYNKVIYTAEGEAYVSGHIELKIDEPYLTR